MSYIKNNDTEMYAKKITYDNKTSIIELVDSVTIIRNDEKIIGDYGTLDTKNNSYKIKSNNDTKVKVIIQNNE
jgi:lipopolysaccharide transport protein LptA